MLRRIINGRNPMHRFAFLPLLALTACSQPVTRAPQVDTGLLTQEEREQARFAAESEGKPLLTTYDKREISNRLRVAAPKVIQAGYTVCMQMLKEQRQCYFDVGMATKGPVNAWADGEKVMVTPAMVAFTASEAELAMVVAHEYAHNVLKHVQSTQMNSLGGALAGALVDAFAASRGWNTGSEFSGLGAEMGRLRYSIAFEKEADYVGLYIVARAGYDLRQAQLFWRRMSAYDPDGIYGGSTHPSNAERFVAMNAVIREIDAKQQAGQPLLPEMGNSR